MYGTLLVFVQVRDSENRERSRAVHREWGVKREDAQKLAQIFRERNPHLPLAHAVFKPDPENVPLQAYAKVSKA